jgi:hypothetical protein
VATESVTVLFTDLVGSTELSSSLSPEAGDEVRRKALLRASSGHRFLRGDRGQEPRRRAHGRFSRPRLAPWPDSRFSRCLQAIFGSTPVVYVEPLTSTVRGSGRDGPSEVGQALAVEGVPNPLAAPVAVHEPGFGQDF